MFDFLLTNLPIIICVIAGLLLLVIEMFTPGFGIPGLSGIISLLASVVIFWRSAGALAGLGLLFIIVALIIIVLATALKSASTGRLSRSSIILKETERPEDGYLASSDLGVHYVGKKGSTSTMLRPSGIADIDGVRLNVISEGSYIQKGAEIIVDRVEGNRIVVHEL